MRIIETNILLYYVEVQQVSTLWRLTEAHLGPKDRELSEYYCREKRIKIYNS